MKTVIIPVPTGVKGYIFDLDGTIIDSMPMHLKSYNYALEVWGIVYLKEVFQSRAGIPTLKTLEMIAEEYDVKNPDYDEVIGRIRYYEMNNSGQITMIEPIHDIIKDAHDRLPMAIGTGNSRKHVDLLVDQFSLDLYFPHIVTATEVANGKPHPETFLKCAELIGIEPGDCVVFEDGMLGIQAAEAAGMQVVDVTKYL
ncbi:MAG: beta-phosphoglucomutase-like phosphatase (HAD superfamily) [Cyclobacteriaceae bacterium]|jgi:beta-phosphoglucomutase-like phosphatase (HAD superfamily)